MKQQLKKQQLKLTAAALLLGSQAQAVTFFQTDATAVAVANWDTWSQASAVPASLDQGSATVTNNGISITASNVTTRVIDGYTSPPGGFLGNPDTYYFHDGGAQWDASVSFDSAVDFVRISYSLLGFGGGAPDAYALAPTISGATEVAAGTYDDGTASIFFHDFALPGGTTDIASTFGDVVFPGFPGSFRSVDAIQVEGFTGSAPAVIPEPSVLFLLAGSLLGLGLRRKR